MKNTFLILLSSCLMACQNTSSPTCENATCGSQPYYDAIVNLEWENTHYQFNGQLFDNALRKQDPEYDMVIARLEEQAFLPILETIQATTGTSFDHVIYTVLYIGMDLSLENRLIQQETIRGVDFFAYNATKQRYTRTLYQRATATAPFQQVATSSVKNLVYDQLGAHLKNNLFPNSVQRGYLVLQNLTRGKKIYEANKPTSMGTSNPSNSYQKDQQRMCDGPCGTLDDGDCKDNGLQFVCNGDGECISTYIDDIIPRNANLVQPDAYYALRDRVLTGTTKGDQYINSYYYLSSVLGNSNLSPLISNIKNALPRINQAVTQVLDVSQHGHELAVDDAFHTLLRSICSDLKQITVSNIEQANYLAAISTFEGDLSTVHHNRMTIRELIQFLNT